MLLRPARLSHPCARLQNSVSAVRASLANRSMADSGMTLRRVYALPKGVDMTQQLPGVLLCADMGIRVRYNNNFGSVNARQ